MSKVVKVSDRMYSTIGVVGLTGVGVSFHGVAALCGNGVDGQDLVVPRRRDHGVYVQLVDDVLRLVPPRCSFAIHTAKIRHWDLLCFAEKDDLIRLV